MTGEKIFDHKEYIQKKLREIDDLDERRYAKELLLGSLGEMFAWMETKYKALEQRIRDDLDNPWECFNISMTVAARADYDPINSFWNPLCQEDIRPASDTGRVSIYLMADDAECRRFAGHDTIEATDKKTGQIFRYRIMKPERYQICMERTHTLFINNHIPWQTIHMGHLERFFDLMPEENIPAGAQPVFEWGSWEQYVRQDVIPLWNMNRRTLQSQEFRHPCLDEVFYEHIYYLGDEGDGGDGCLVDAEEEILTIRYEKNKVVLKTRQESLGDVSVCRLCQGDGGDSYGYHYPVLSNCRADNFASRYIRRSGNFIQTPMELMRRIEELSGIFRISVTGYEITGVAGEDLSAQHILEGDMNSFIGTQVFTGDTRNLLVVRFRKEEDTPYDYLYGSQIRYILSQLQMEFMEYRCMGVVE